ncbi:hypothetical protein Q3H58_003494 [Pseudomonas psychrotolerans]|nr:hypothetical protein [Pseudomonas psychrotolerans]
MPAIDGINGWRIDSLDARHRENLLVKASLPGDIIQLAQTFRHNDN